MAVIVGVLRARVSKTKGSVRERLVAGRIEHVPARDVDTTKGQVGQAADKRRCSAMSNEARVIARGVGKDGAGVLNLVKRNGPK